PPTIPGSSLSLPAALPFFGRWYELIRLPLKYEDDAATDITAQYSLKDNGAVRVDNRCFDKDQQPSQAIGEAKPVDETNAKLKVKDRKSTRLNSSHVKISYA